MLSLSRAQLVSLFVLALAGISAFSFRVEADSPKEKENMIVSKGKKVSIEYTVSHEGKVLSSNVGKQPLTYSQGNSEIVPGLEEAMEGMHIGDTKKVTVNPDKGYGPIDNSAVIEVPKEQVPPEAQIIGTHLTAHDAQGNMLQPVVRELKDKTIMLDFNHPLAGKTLEFDVKVVEVQ